MSQSGTTRLNTDKSGWQMLLMDYLRRCPATVANVASHFGMRQADADDALWAAAQQGWVRHDGHGRWEAVNV